MKFIALDIGSSSIKGTTWNLPEQKQSTPVVRVSCPAPIAKLPPGHFELCPTALVKTITQVLESCLEHGGPVDGIVSCNQMAGLILADTQGNPLTNYLSWRDQRVLETMPGTNDRYYDIACARLGPAYLEQLGHECKLGSAPSLLFWLNENHSLPDHAIPLMLGDYVAMQLAGAKPATEFTNSLGSFNLTTGTWHHEAFASLNLPSLPWPELTTPYQPIGEYTHGHLRIPWYPSVGDHQCALAGALLQPDELSINASTGSQVSLLSQSHIPGNYQVRPYFEQQFLNTLTHLPAGRSLNALIDLLGELARSQGTELADPWPYILQAAAEAETDLAAELTFFSGPLGERGNLRNISLENLNIGSLFLAAFRNMADNYATCAQRLAPNQGWKTLVLSGGLLQRPSTLQHMILERFNRPYRLCPTEEETFTGMLALALVASGEVTDLATASKRISETP